MRISSRTLQLKDAEAICQAMQDPEILRWLPALPLPYLYQNAVDFINRSASLQDRAITVDGRFAGMIREGNNLGYWLVPQYRGRGIMHRAAQVVLIRYFSGSDTPVNAIHLTDNLASRRVLLALGFHDSGPADIPCRGGKALSGCAMVLPQEIFTSSLDIRTERCWLGPMTEADFPALHQIVTCPSVARMLLHLYPEQSLADVSELLRPAMNPLLRPMWLAIRHGKRCIGTVGVAGDKIPSVFYFLAPDVAGQGFASEIVPVFCDTVQDWYGLDMLRAEVFTDNPASRRVLEKSGFEVVESILLPSAGCQAPARGRVLHRITNAGQLTPS